VFLSFQRVKNGMKADEDERDDLRHYSAALTVSLFYLILRNSFFFFFYFDQNIC